MSDPTRCITLMNTERDNQELLVKVAQKLFRLVVWLSRRSKFYLEKLLVRPNVFSWILTTQYKGDSDAKTRCLVTKSLRTENDSISLGMTFATHVCVVLSHNKLLLKVELGVLNIFVWYPFTERAELLAMWLVARWPVRSAEGNWLNVFGQSGR